MRYLILFALLSQYSIFQAQVYKYEREKKVCPKNVPEKALASTAFLKDLKVKVKWYREESFQGVNYELKCRFDKHVYSIKFDSSGAFYDLEKLIDFNSFDNNIKDSINLQLSEKFQKFNIYKTQLQWVGPDINIERVLKDKNDDYQNIEIEVKGQLSTAYEYREYLFDRNANLLEERIIINKVGTEHLEF